MSPKSRLLLPSIVLLLFGVRCMLGPVPEYKNVSETDARTGNPQDDLTYPDAGEGSECTEVHRTTCLEDSQDRLICDRDLTLSLFEACEPQEVCETGRCVDPNLDRARCESDLDCPGTPVCLFGVCGERAALELGQRCRNSLECGPGLRCDSEACVPEISACESGEQCPMGRELCAQPAGVCSSGANDSPCQDRNDCQEDHYCLQMTATDALGETAEQSVCSDGLETAPCNNDQDCRVGGCFFYRCFGGHSNSPCHDETDCEALVDGACVFTLDCVAAEEPASLDVGFCAERGVGECCSEWIPCGPALICAGGICQ